MNLALFNSSFLVELMNENSSEFKLFSANNLLNPPKLRVYYREFLSDSVVLDTSFHTYYSSQDVSVIDKPDIVSTDSDNLSAFNVAVFSIWAFSLAYESVLI